MADDTPRLKNVEITKGWSEPEDRSSLVGVLGKQIHHDPEYRATFEWKRDGVQATYVVPVVWFDHGNRVDHKKLERIEAEGLEKLKAVGLLP